MMTWFKAKIKWFAVLSLVAVFGIIAYAPYLPRLLQEGYPSLTWPAPGYFVRLSTAHEKGMPRPKDALFKRGNLEQGLIPQQKINKWSQQLFDDKGGKALLVYHRGRLVVEHYARGFDKNSRFNSYSMVKSLVGAMTLKAFAERKISSLNDPIGTYLVGIKDKNLAQTPLKDFLGMRSGIMFEPVGTKAAFGGRVKDIDRSKLNPFGPMVRLHMNGLDTVMSGLRADKQLRGRYNYQNINTALLGRVLQKVYQQPLEKILQEKIWKPSLSFRGADWRRFDKDKAVTPYCCLYARPKDWVSVGRYIMSNGRAVAGAGKQEGFLPEKLWRLYMGMDIAEDSFSGKSKYGAHIYHNILDRAGEPLQGKFTYMFGSRGQTVYMMPEKDLVVVRFGEKIQLLHSTLYAAWRMVKS